MSETKSIWRSAADIPRRARLEKELRADVAVIGAGLAGVLTAYMLKSRGLSVVVLEANRIASGQTRNTTAKITSQHGMIYDALISRFGDEMAGQYARANEAALSAYSSIIEGANIDCDFRRANAYIYSTTASEPMRREAEAAKALGLDAAYTIETELPFPVAGAVRFARQAAFHPLKFIKAVSEDIEIYEDSRVLNVEGNRAATPRGAVSAQKIVFAAHYPFINVPGWYFLRMHQERSYVLALKSRLSLDGMYYGTDADGISLRSADGFLLFSGGGHRAGENSEGGRYETLERRARELLGDISVAAQDCVTLDGAPYIGCYSSSKPDWYVATGFGKWGMTFAMVSAIIISSEICGEAPEWADVFSPSRLRLSASAKNLATEAAQAFKGLAREALPFLRGALDDLPNGHGGIVEAHGRKAGVYKDAEGRCYAVDARCPHLGCQVEWNPDERSWDCPCHGSRFNYDGTLLDDPAQTSLERAQAAQD